jgi:diguanylate cyclase (GGDEF)-like protein
LRTFRIGQRLVLCLTLILLLMLSGMALSVVSYQDSREMLHRRTSASTSRLSDIKSIRRMVEKEDSLAQRLGMANTIEEANADMKGIELDVEANRALIARLGRSSDSSDDRALVEAIQGYDASLQATIVSARRSVDGFNPGMAARILSRQMDPVHSRWLQDLDQLTDLQTQRIALEIDSMDKAARKTDFEIEIVAAMALLFAAIVGWRLTVGITGPLRRAVEFATAVGSGNLDAPLPAASQDECGMLLLALKNMASRLQSAHDEMQRLAIVDGLTGAYNRRHFDAELRKEFALAARSARKVSDSADPSPVACLSLMLIDVDHFKTYNDRFGHPAGDACLRAIVRSVLRAGLRPSDLVARYGGEEFVVVLPHCSLEDAYAVAERVRLQVEQLHLCPGSGIEIPVTVSIGVATMQRPDCSGPDELVGFADAAMYEAKHSGRNTVRPVPLECPLEPESISRG